MLDMDDRQIRAVVEDNGIGFDQQVLDTTEGPPGGLQRLRNRVHQIGGTLEVDSSEGGSRLILSLPAGD
jgi:signal transduction histidine kinase